jgi:hypothetical protein
MKKYNANTAKSRGEATIGEMKYGSVLEGLNGSAYWQRHGWPRQPLPRLVDRTDTGKHYRLIPGLASVMGIEIVQPQGDHGSKPPTELATVSAVVEAVDRYASAYSDAPRTEAIVMSIHRAIEMKLES